jgi:hypothetical protein
MPEHFSVIVIEKLLLSAMQIFLLKHLNCHFLNKMAAETALLLKYFLDE